MSRESKEAVCISHETARRFILGRQGLWPGRRWVGKQGAAEAIRYAGSIQMDPLCVVARSHDIALWGRVTDYAPEHLDELIHRNRACFDYGGCLNVYPMEELPHFRLPMRRRSESGRWAEWAKIHTELIREVREAIRARGPLGNRDFTGREPAKTAAYRGRKDTGPALYYLWITGELMTHSRRNFQRLYALREQVAPEHLDFESPAEEAERFFARKAIQEYGITRASAWAYNFGAFIHRKVGKAESLDRLRAMVDDGLVTEIAVEEWKEPHYLLSEDLPLLHEVAEGRIPVSWRPAGTTTEEEVTFLAPLEMVSARGRAKKLFDYDYVWEVYKPAHLRRWGYYTLPILYGDRLVGRLDPRLDRKTGTLHILGFWLEHGFSPDARFAEAFARGLARFRRFLNASRVDSSAVEPVGPAWGTMDG